MSGSLIVGKERTFYALYQKDSSVIHGPICFACVLLFVVCFGLVGNFGIVVLTYRSPRLKNSCNYLLALLCLSDCVHQTGHFSYIYRMFTGNYFIRLESCFLLQIVPLIGVLFGAILPLIISFDRLSSCFFPLFYRTLKPTYYIVFVISVSGLYVLVTFYAVSQQMSEHGNQLLLCAVPDPVISQRTTNLIFQLSTGLMNAIAVSIYVAVWIGLRLGRRLFSWVAGAIGQLILMLIDANPQQFFYSVAGTGWLEINLP
ncbi:G protein-coupled receptor [Aphelenchoides besseyi]|nr:G protein-coupled receptor [Aphelenchoides besseyi]